MDKEIATLCIDKAWIYPQDKSLIMYNLVDPDDKDHELMTPRSSKLGKLLLKEIKEAEREAQLDEAQEDRRPHPYGSAGDDSGEVSVAPVVGRSLPGHGHSCDYRMNPW